MGNRKNTTSKIKAEIVLSLLRGEDAELLSREHGVTIADLSSWRDQFIENGTTGFKRRPDDSKLSAAGMPLLAAGNVYNVAVTLKGTKLLITSVNVTDWVNSAVADAIVPIV